MHPVSGNPTLTNIANESLGTTTSTLLTLLRDSSIPASTVGHTAAILQTTRDAAHKMLIDASYSNKGYEEADFSQDTKRALRDCDRMIAVATAFGAYMGDA